MEEPALYRAILESPHDDTARLVYADWLDEFAETLAEPQARLERGRAELIRVQCQIARRGPGGWGRNREIPIPPEVLKRQKRLRFLYSEKLRRRLPGPLAGHPFDRGFLRPLRHLRADELLRDLSAAPGYVGAAPPFHLIPLLPSNHPIYRYAPGVEPFDVFPLWDVHLFAWSDQNSFPHPTDDFGQYGAQLARCARSPALARIGLLKVSFFRTAAEEFFRTGNFANVETLILNCGPFQDVLEAVAGNDSFRSLRYVEFGEDDWAWAATPAARERFEELEPKLRELNASHLPYGEMRPALRRLLGGLEPIPVVRLPLRMPDWARLPAPPTPVLDTAPVIRWRPAPAPAPPGRLWYAVLIVVFALLVLFACLMVRGRSEPTVPAHKFDYNPDLYKIPPAVREVEKWKAPKAEPVAPDGAKE